MPKPRGATTDAVAALTIADTYRIANTIDPTTVYPRFGPLPAVTGVRNQTGPWNTIGFTRQLMLSDGGSVIEQITDVTTPTFFGYELSDFQNIFGTLVSGASAEWQFSEIDGGTRIRWTYTFHPRAGAGLIVGAIVNVFWARYMRRVLPHIVREVERIAAASQP